MIDAYRIDEVAQAPDDVREIVALDDHVEIHDDALVLFVRCRSMHDLNESRETSTHVSLSPYFNSQFSSTSHVRHLVDLSTGAMAKNR